MFAQPGQKSDFEQAIGNTFSSIGNFASNVGNTIAQAAHNFTRDFYKQGIENNLQKIQQQPQPQLPGGTSLYQDVKTPIFKMAQDFSNDFQTRLGRVDQRYIEPVKNEVGSFLNFVQGNDQVRNKRLAELYPQPTNEADRFKQMADMAINFSPMGLERVGVKAGELLVPKLAEEGKAILSKLDKTDRLAHLVNYANELLKVGYTKPQIDQIGAHEAAAILKQSITPAERFGSANESMKFLKDVTDEVRKVKDPMGISQTIDNAIKTVDVKNKVNLLDYFRTPDRVLEKIGFKKESDLIKQKYNDYLDELPKEIERITQWSKQVTPDANQRIFQWLDGKKVSLADNELQVATEIKSYLKSWADRLGLPEDKRITDYITHIFPQGVIEKEFDPEVASLIRGKVAASVYDPFLKQRLNKPEYLQDTWQALDAYVKRAVRKVHMDQALEQVKAKTGNLEDSQFNYVKSYIDRINLRPSEIDNLIDNLIKSSPFGYRAGQRPLTVITQRARQMVYRGLLGLNVKTALLNLTQGANTYAKLGEKYVLIGYSKVLQNLPKFLAGQGTELHDVGILRDNIIQDRTLNATKKFWEKTDQGLLYLFNLAEKINRGAAYWGAKSRALAQGKTEQEAVKEAIDLVRQTQFTFGSVDTPLALSSDLAKTFGQFQSFTLKQGEFLGEMFKNKDIKGMVRWIASSLFMVTTLGKLWGMKPEDLIPSVRFGTPPTLQGPYGAYQIATGQPDQFGNPADPNFLKRALENKNLQKGVINYIPGGAQIKKTYEGLNAVDQKGVYTPKGDRLKFPATDQAPIFGPGNSPFATDYYQNNLEPFTKTETQLYKSLINSGKTPEEAYNQIREQKAKKKQIDDAIKNKESLNLVKPVSAADQQSALLEALAMQKETTQKNKLIKEIFSSGSTKEEIEKMLAANNLGTFESASLLMAKSLGIKERSNYIKTLITGLDNQSYQSKVQELAKAGILTTQVTTNMLANDQVTYAEKAKLDALIKQTRASQKGKVSGSRKLKIKKIPLRKFLISSKVKKFKPVKVPRMLFKPLKPTKIKKIKSYTGGRVAYA